MRAVRSRALIPLIRQGVPGVPQVAEVAPGQAGHDLGPRGQLPGLREAPSAPSSAGRPARVPGRHLQLRVGRRKTSRTATVMAIGGPPSRSSISRTRHGAGRSLVNHLPIYCSAAQSGSRTDVSPSTKRSTKLCGPARNSRVPSGAVTVLPALMNMGGPSKSLWAASARDAGIHVVLVNCAFAVAARAGSNPLARHEWQWWRVEDRCVRWRLGRRGLRRQNNNGQDADEEVADQFLVRSYLSPCDSGTRGCDSPATRASFESSVEGMVDDRSCSSFVTRGMNELRVRREHQHACDSALCV
jgi:hypothetical protein